MSDVSRVLSNSLQATAEKVLEMNLMYV